MAAPYEDREDAGRRLAAALADTCSGPCVVAGIPRGGLAVALPVAAQLAAPLGVVFVHKLTLPSAPELAIGAVDEDGHSLLNADCIAALHASTAEVTRARGRARRRIREQREHYGVPPLHELLPGRTLVLVDDGLATGITARAAVTFARRHGAGRIVVAAPCASREAEHRLAPQADGFVSLIVDEDFFSVDEYYEEFPPLSDADVVEILERARHTAVHDPGGTATTELP